MIQARVLFIPHVPFVRKINKFINKGRVTPQVESYTYNNVFRIKPKWIYTFKSFMLHLEFKIHLG